MDPHPFVPEVSPGSLRERSHALTLALPHAHPFRGRKEDRNPMPD